jgi:sugar phosphate isomerase/epimerase
MKIGALTSLFFDKTLEETLDYLQGVGFEAVEFYSGAMAAPCHCDPEVLLQSGTELQKFKDTVSRHNMFVSLLNCSGNPVSPVGGEGEKHRRAFQNTVLLAEKLGVDRVAVFSGCPGGGPGDQTPNWVTCAWPDEYLGILDYQWNEVLIPYWEKASKFALDHGVNKIAFEMHPGFCVYNPETLMKLRSAVGPAIGANFDPSHLFWQGIDIPKAILLLNEAIFHIHAKDTRVYKRNIEVNGVLDTKHYSKLKERAWVFGTVGYGHGETVWKEIIDTLGIIGYDYVLSIEHEDSLMAKTEGLEKAFKFLKRIAVKDKPDKMWWA